MYFQFLANPLTSPLTFSANGEIQGRIVVTFLEAGEPDRMASGKLLVFFSVLPECFEAVWMWAVVPEHSHCWARPCELSHAKLHLRILLLWSISNDNCCRVSGVCGSVATGEIRGRLNTHTVPYMHEWLIWPSTTQNNNPIPDTEIKKWAIKKLGYRNCIVGANTSIKGAFGLRASVPSYEYPWKEPFFYK